MKRLLARTPLAISPLIASRFPAMGPFFQDFMYHLDPLLIEGDARRVERTYDKCVSPPHALLPCGYAQTLKTLALCALTMPCLVALPVSPRLHGVAAAPHALPLRRSYARFCNVVSS